MFASPCRLRKFRRIHRYLPSFFFIRFLFVFINCCILLYFTVNIEKCLWDSRKLPSVNLSPLFPEKMTLSMEIRDRVVDYVQKRIAKLQKNKNPVCACPSSLSPF